MGDESGRNGGNVILAFTLGALVGAAAAVLFAPASGSETRKRIKDFTGDVIGKAGEYAGSVKGKVSGSIQKGKEAISDRKNMIKSAIEAGKEAYIREKERVERDEESAQSS
ncbi:MAG: YtxH domain-containing protein [Nitrospiraceae bacterium]|nr:YtxH domain-containing protein [Nitrospiraceae bacterium]MDA8090339.1 YtxH domain-containing protein [Nitrospiraceae bacterium]